jgi:hypothetical protein
MKRSIRTAAAALFVVGLLSPANAAYQHDAVSLNPDLPLSATADHTDGKDTSSAVARNRALKLTSRRPWLAPVGHRQPRRDEVAPSEVVSTTEHQQQLDQELNRKLKICRGC